MPNKIQAFGGAKSASSHQAHLGYEAHGKPSGGAKAGFGSAISVTSTSSVKNMASDVQTKIDCALKGSQSDVGNMLREIAGALDGMMTRMEGQAGKKGACSAAGSMNTLAQDLNNAVKQKDQPNQMTKEIRDILQQISNLLTKLENTMHTSPKMHAAFQGRS